ncbi:MAG TPA: glycosyltransferase family 4 protein [Solirubrobacteraceae bacterium]|nr:glycosyltransferase family 4 protein [Solirubrobacteraceae bacterium]
MVETSEPRRFYPEALLCFRALGVDLAVATVFGRGAAHEQFRAAGVPSYSLCCRRAFDYPLAGLRLARIARSRGTDVIHGIEAVPALISGIAGRFTGLPSVFHRQHIEFVDLPGMTALSRVASHVTTMTVGCSEAAAHAATVFDHVPPSALAVVHNPATKPRPVDASEAARIRAELGISAEDAVVTVVSRLRQEKNLDTLLAAVSLASRACSRPLHVVVVGDGPCESELRDLAARDPDVRAHFVGHQDDVALWFAISDVCAIPSRREALGIAAVEAMSYGKPVLAGDVGGLREVVLEAVTGLRVAPDNLAAMAAAICELVNDPERAQAMGEAGRRRYLEAFTVQTWTESLVGEWERLRARGV